ncbi:hypothetical protein XH93_11485 [Bradyrhizobium sp. CCBAU 51753]|nr:hypothetical protein XH93_11485 [Bradyrhizobium sp. CCBAU 51753]
MFRENDVAIEENKPGLELLFWLEVWLGLRVEGLDECDLFEGDESFSDREDFHGTLLCWLRRFWCSETRCITLIERVGNRSEMYWNPS